MQAKIRIGERDQWTCRQCKRGPLTENESILDHITPLAQGGSHEDTNLQTLCHACSRVKTQRESCRPMGDES
jgi:5-methylcytosine-specific restriction enzyme A